MITILGPKKGIPPLAAARLQRWAWTLSAYLYEIEFRSTGDHANADGLSRLLLKYSPPNDPNADARVFNISQMEALPVTTRQLKFATSSDKLLSTVIRYTQGSWPAQVPPELRPFYNRRSELTVEEGCLLWGFRVIIPLRLQDKLLNELHKDHPGVTRMKAVARSFMWWPGLDKRIESVAKACATCQAVKASPPSVPLRPWVWPSKPWQRVHLDFAGPFQGSMFLVAVDAFSKWPEVRVMSSTTVPVTLEVLREWFSVHGIPEQVVTDNGSQFTADAFKVFMDRNGVRHIRSAPYHPASNGLAERFVQSLKQSLKATLNDGRSLTQRLSSFLLTYRTTPHATTGVAPCTLLMNRDLRTRFNLLRPDREKFVTNKQAAQKSCHDRRARSRVWVVGDRVMVRNVRPGPDWIAGTVLEVLGPVTYVVETEDGSKWKRHADQLKDWLPFTSTFSEVAPDSLPDEVEAPSEGSPDGSVVADNESEPPAEIRSNEPSPPPVTDPPPVPATEPPRYPQRNRQPPRYYSAGEHVTS